MGNQAAAVAAVTLVVNGQSHALRVEAGESLVDCLRDRLGLTGTHIGCDTAQCGACTVLLDGEAVKACNLLAWQAEGAEVETIEGLCSPGQALHPMQAAFGAQHGLQCGFCTPGMILRAIAMDAEGVPAEPDAVRAALAGNLCRCTGYEGIVAAIVDGLNAMRSCRKANV
ncbi:MAG: (2Fe-2S)-binding protein [Burkholderiaceae bacterium]|nr:(2Fe-2S)-binding protein [Burkholderiaceae bacterium]